MRAKSFWLVATALLALAAGPAMAADPPGVTATEIKIGNTMPYSGPASAYGVIGKGETAFFNMINEQGGIGGLASISGAFYGAVFIQFVPNVADQLSKAAPWAIYGVFLIAFMYLMPSGVAGMIRILRRRLAAQRMAAPAVTAPAHDVQLPPLTGKEAG